MELREACRITFHPSWYLEVFVVTSYGQKHCWTGPVPANRQLQLSVSPRDSHQILPAIGGGTQTPEFDIGKTKGISKTNPEL